MLSLVAPRSLHWRHLCEGGGPAGGASGPVALSLAAAVLQQYVTIALSCIPYPASHIANCIGLVTAHVLGL